MEQQPYKIIFIPRFMNEMITQATLHDEQYSDGHVLNRFQMAKDLAELELKYNIDDIYLYLLYNKQLTNLPSPQGGLLFPEFKNVLLEDTWFSDHLEEFENYEKDRLASKKDEENPLSTSFDDLLKYNRAIYDQNKRILFLFENTTVTITNADDAEEQYTAFLQNCLEAIGKYTPFEDLIKFHLFDSFTKRNKGVYRHIELTKERVKQMDEMK